MVEKKKTNRYVWECKVPEWLGILPIIIAMRLEGRSNEQIAKEFGVSRQAIEKKLKRWKNRIEGLKLFKKHEDDLFTLMRMSLFFNADNKIKDMQGYDLIKSIEILFKLEQLKQGQPTERINYQRLCDIERELLTRKKNDKC